MKTNFKINYFFILTFIAGLIIAFSSCERNKTYNFDCGYYYETVYVPCPVVVLIPRVLNNATYSQMHDFEQANDCHCLPTYCPEY